MSQTRVPVREKCAMRMRRCSVVLVTILFVLVTGCGDDEPAAGQQGTRNQLRTHCLHARSVPYHTRQRSHSDTKATLFAS